MTEEQAKNIGSKQLIKYTFILVLIFELYWMFTETKGDFGNGILFYISYHASPILWIFYTIVFGSNYLLGKKAGTEIIINKNNTFKSGLKYGLMISAEIILFQIIVLTINKKEIIQHLIQSFIIVFAILSSWMLAVWKIKQIGDKREIK